MPPWSGQYVVSLSVPGGEESAIKWRITYTDSDGVSRTIGSTFYTAYVDENQGVLLIPVLAGAPATENNSWIASAAGFIQPGSLSQLTWNVPIPLAEGVRLDEWRYRCRKVGGSDFNQAVLVKMDDVTGSTNLSTLTAAATGYQTLADVTLSDVITSPNLYTVSIAMDPFTVAGDVRGLWLSFTYTRFNGQQGV